MPTRKVTIDFLPGSSLRYLDHDALVCVDPLLTTTTLVSKAARGERAYLGGGTRIGASAASGDGTELLLNAAPARNVYAACFRNLSATARWIAERHQRVAILGAGRNGRPTCQDRMAAARLAQQLVDHGFAPAHSGVTEAIERWARIDLGLIRLGSSAEALHAAGQRAEVDLVISRHDDLSVVCRMWPGDSKRGGYIAAVDATESARYPAAV